MTAGREHFESMLLGLHDELIKMASLVEERIKEATSILETLDTEQAQHVISRDIEVNMMELDIEEKCIKLIATQQPAAKDLREVVTGLKIVTELERIGDYATDIAKLVKRLPSPPVSNGIEQIVKMSEKVTEFLMNAVDCFIKRDEISALRLAITDDEVDAAYKNILLWAMEYMRDNGKDANEIMSLIFVTKYLERIADRATNICEWAIYLSTGERKELQ